MPRCSSFGLKNHKRGHVPIQTSTVGLSPSSTGFRASPDEHLQLGEGLSQE